MQVRGLPWQITWIAAGLLAPLLALFSKMGFVQVNAHFFIVDLLVSLITAIAFMGFVEKRSVATRLLSSRPLQFLGQFSYSLYLIHGAIVSVFFAHRF